MSRKLRAAVAQLGPIHLADSRAAVVKRLIALMREAHAGGRPVCRLSRTGADDVLSALVDDRPGRDRPVLRARDAGPRDPAAVRTGARSRDRLLSRLCRTDRGRRADAALQHVDPGRARRADRRPLSQDPPARPFRAPARSAVPASRKALFRRRQRGVQGVARASTRSSACASATTGAGPRPIASWGCRGSRSSRSATTRRPRTSTTPSPCTCGCSTTSCRCRPNAYQNATWVLAAAKCGAEDGFGMIGGSAIVAPTGEIAAQALDRGRRGDRRRPSTSSSATTSAHGLRLRKTPPRRALRADHRADRRQDRGVMGGRRALTGHGDVICHDI